MAIAVLVMGIVFAPRAWSRSHAGLPSSPAVALPYLFYLPVRPLGDVTLSATGTGASWIVPVWPSASITGSPAQFDKPGF